MSEPRNVALPHRKFEILEWIDILVRKNDRHSTGAISYWMYPVKSHPITKAFEPTRNSYNVSGMLVDHAYRVLQRDNGSRNPAACIDWYHIIELDKASGRKLSDVEAEKKAAEEKKEQDEIDRLGDFGVEF